MATYNAGIVTAYGAAVQGGYTGTYEQFCTMQAHFAENAAAAQDAAQRAEQAAATLTIDATLTHAGQAADAKKAGDEISAVKDGLTAVEDDVADVKEEYVELSSSDFVNGVYLNGVLAPTDKRICTPITYSVYAGDKIVITSTDHQIEWDILNSNKAVSSFGWATVATETTFIVPTNGKLAVEMRNSNDSAISPNDYDATIKIYHTVRHHADRGAEADIQSKLNLNGLKIVNDGSATSALSMMNGKYINTSGATVTNGNTTLAISDFVQIDPYVSKISYTHKAPVTVIMYSINFYDADYTWLGGSNDAEILATDFPVGTKYAVICDYDSTSAHDTCTVTLYGFERIDDIADSVSRIAESTALDTDVLNPDVFIDKSVVKNTNINYTTGNADSNASFFACNYIAVDAETTYHVMRNNNKLSSTGNLAFYNSNKAYISGQQSIWSDWTTPAGCAYVRFSVYVGSYTQDTASFDGVVIVKGASASAVNSISMFKSAQFSPLYGKKWVGIGDSLTEVNARADLRYWNYIVQPYGMTFVNFGVGGTGYINRQNESKAFYQRALNIDTDADVITVFGGVNDCLFASASMGEPTDTGTTTWCGCVNALIDNIRSLYSYAPIGIISPLPCDWVDGNNETQYDTQLPSDTTCRMSMFVDKLKTICALRGVPFLDLFHTSGMMPNNSSFNEKYYSCGDARTGDGLHPNSAGHKLFYRKIEKFIETLLAE